MLSADPISIGDRNSISDFSGAQQAHSLRQLLSRQIREPVSSFIGRAAEVERLSRMLRSATGAVATITGVRNVGGIGKTELAYRVAVELQALFPIQVLVDLRGQSEAPMRPELALERVIRVLPGGDTRLPIELEPLINLYRSLLSGQRVLIVADDARDAAQVRPLLPPPGCALLITTRNRISLPGATTHHLLELDALPSADAAALLRTLYSRLSSMQAAELAARVSNQPLALQILGNVLRDDPTRQYPDLFQQLKAERARLETLRPGEGTSLDMQAAIGMGWRNIDPWSRSALAQLTIFNGAFDREAAEAVVTLPEHASALPEILRRLQRSYLLEFDSKSYLFQIHTLVRAFAQAQSDTSHEQPARTRFALHYTRVLQSCEQRFREGREGLLEGLARFDRDRAHFEAAQMWAAERSQQDENAAKRCIELALLGHSLLTQRLAPRLRLRWLEAALNAARRLGDTSSEGRLLGYVGLVYRDLGQMGQALDYYNQSLQVCRKVGDRNTEGHTLSSLGLAHLEMGQTQQAVACFQPSLAIARELNDRRGEGNALGNLGLAHLELGQAGQAIANFEQELAIARSLSDMRSEGRALGNLGLAQRMNGQPQKAIEYYDQHLKIAVLVGDRRGEGNSSWNRALALLATGRRKDAIAAAEIALRIREESCDPRAEKVRAALSLWKAATRPGTSNQ